MNESIIQKYVAELKAQQQEIATSTLIRPHSEMLHYGVMAGRYQGIQNALDVLDSILRDETEKELRQ